MEVTPYKISSHIFGIILYFFKWVWMGGGGGGGGDINVSCQLKFWPFASCQLNFRPSVS